MPRINKRLVELTDGRFKYLRGEQGRIIRKCIGIINRRRNKKRFIFIQAPTGVGKSLIGQYIARDLELRSLTLVKTRELENQYLRDFPDLAQIHGRSDYSCLTENVSADKAACVLGLSCRLKRTVCPYYVAKRNALQSPHAITNYAFAFIDALFSEGLNVNRQLLVLDEIHLLEASLSNLLTVNIRQSMQQRFGCNFYFSPDKDKQMRDKQTDQSISILQHRLEELLSSIQIHGLFEPVLVTDNKTRHTIFSIIDTIQKLKILKLMGDNVTISEYPGGFNVRPLGLSTLASKFIIGDTPHIIGLSATILDPEMLANTLGIDPHDIEYITTDAAFPIANRPIYFYPVVWLNYRSDDDDYRLLSETIDDILKRHTLQRGIIFTSSFRITEKILEFLSDESRNRCITFGANKDVRRAVKEFIKDPREDAVLIGPGLETGLDFPDDISRFQIIAKIPFPDISDMVVQHKLSQLIFGHRWYLWQTLSNAIQATGRSVRSRKDYAVTYILDGALEFLLKASAGMVPKWWYSAVTRVNSLEEIPMNRMF